MSSFFELTLADFSDILDPHSLSDKASQIFEEQYDDEMIARIEQAVSHHVELDDQVAEAYAEVENILIERKVIKPPKHFSCMDEDEFEPDYESDYGDDEFLNLDDDGRDDF